MARSCRPCRSYFDTLRTLPCFAKLAPFDVTVWNDHVEDVDTLAARLVATQVPIRERTKIDAQCEAWTEAETALGAWTLVRP